MSANKKRFQILVQFHRYDPVGRCIYCHNADRELTTEHIIPHGMGGRLELPQASCLGCNDITSKRETQYQNDVIRDFKTALRLPPRRGRLRRGTIPIEIKAGDGSFERITIPHSDAPSYLLLPNFQVPELILGKPWIDIPPMMLGLVINPRAGLRLVEQHREIRPPAMKFNATSFGLMLAKIGHAYAHAAAPNMMASMNQLLPKLIRFGVPRFPQNVIGSFHPPHVPKTDVLHNITALTFKRPGVEFLVVRMQLFAAWRTPTYDVVVASRDL